MTETLGDVIAEREFHLLDHPGRKITLRIGRPRRTDDGQDWLCPYQVVGIGDEVVRRGIGVDALQALQLVIGKAVPAWLTRLVQENPSLRWEDAEPGNFGL